MKNYVLLLSIPLLVILTMLASASMPALAATTPGTAITFGPAAFPLDEPATMPVCNKPLSALTQGSVTTDGSHAGAILDGSGLSLGNSFPIATYNLPDMNALGRYHFEYSTTQGWFAQHGESKPGLTIAMTATTSSAWTGDHSLRMDVGGTTGDWWAAGGLDNPAPGMTPTGTVTAHLRLTGNSTNTEARLYILDNSWAWSSSPKTALQPGNWITLTWNLSPTVARPIHRFGVQFMGNTPGSLDDTLYVDAIDWSHPAYSQTIYPGAFLSSTGTAGFPSELDCFDNVSGKHIGLINVFVDWTGSYPTDTVNTILAHRSTPLITWQPRVPLADIVAGTYDSYIDEWSQAIAQTPCATVFLRWGHEMNGTWYPWSGDPVAYVAAWRHIHDRMVITNSVRNVVWAWTPNISQGALYTDYPAYYPGDDYVDWVGASGYNWGSKASWDPKPPCLTFDDLFSPILYDLADRYPTKPQMVPEFASACGNGCDKALWIAEAYHQALFYPRLQALVWFDVAKWESGHWVDWRIGCGDCGAPACPGCVAAYAQALTNPRYSTTAPGFVGCCELYVPLVLKSHD